MSDFSISARQRQRLLEGDYRALKFLGAAAPWANPDPLPDGCKVGARYVLAWKRAEAVGFEDGTAWRRPRHPVWYITVTKIRGEPGPWTVRFDVTDLRDRDLFLRPGGGVQAGRDVLDAGRVPDPDWLDSEAEAIEEFWEQERLKRQSSELHRRAEWKRDRRAA